MTGEPALLPPDEQPYTPRLSGCGSLRHELEAVLDAASPEITQDRFRHLVLESNAAGKRSASSRLWAWKRLKVRYVLDPRVPEFRVFSCTMRETRDPSDRGLLEFLMMARTDRLFREVVTECISPLLGTAAAPVEVSCIRGAVEARVAAAGLKWTASVVEGVTSHLLSSAKDFGILASSARKQTRPVRPGTPVTTFAIRLSRLEGLGDRQALQSRWFRILGLGFDAVVDLVYAAARQGALEFRYQADVVEISLPALAEER